MKTLLILVDGMRPDSLAGIAPAQKLMKEASYTLNARTVFPSVTLPCHMSLFHSVDPERHGITTNLFTPQVRPVNGLCEQLHKADKRCAFFYNWEELRDLSRPDTLAYSFFASGHQHGYKYANGKVTDEAIDYIKENSPDFAFVYLGWVDEQGHAAGWMGSEYLHSVEESWKSIEALMNTVSDDYAVIVTADHGGHDRMHGSTLDEDMTIPMFFYGKPFEAGKDLSNISIKDIAPTIAKLTGIENAPEWEGKSIL